MNTLTPIWPHYIAAIRKQDVFAILAYADLKIPVFYICTIIFVTSIVSGKIVYKSNNNFKANM